MKQDNDILNKIGRKTGYKVPDGYFEQFAARMTEQLPEREIPQPEEPSLWQRVKPYIYMAAMFAGIWLMVRVFVQPQVEKSDELTASTEIEDEIIDDYMISSIDDYTIFETLYADND